MPTAGVWSRAGSPDQPKYSVSAFVMDRACTVAESVCIRGFMDEAR